ncbi:carbon-nitrogen hydrolase family protein [Desulfurococcus mucosus]|uniref:Nitrilase/cyanide hydratase and apolipoprotein N-acyltransferase n=1 Tax=Desulfurococcus mucosus (strain ATCC 35584 / DSM 2162 / JCM 9187 / O7/1) TaxID=765177 RepID=E8R8E1_DESM0|nr:carbon-nitrogen hydrolase family protein [Desulfurococcus mucosus]ADV64767.1 Nitrilase/cyanide hydratase and apolipoprotein N-acyltransferase [Desulfurococcus mucosus DSM 2162]
MSSITIGLLQAGFDGLPLENAGKAVDMVRKGFREADLIVLPEYSMLNPFKIGDPVKVYGYAETPVTSKYLSELSRLAEELGAFILAHFIEKTDTPPLTYSTSVLITDKGEAIPVYSKTHLFDAYGFRESSFFKPGKGPGRVVSVKGVKIGFTICYDLRFPELYRLYALSGSDLILVQAGWVKGPYKEEALDKLASVRAHENTVYIALADHVGEAFVGRSGVFNPWGLRELDLGWRETYMEHEVDASLVAEARKTLPVLEQAKAKWEIKQAG